MKNINRILVIGSSNIDMVIYADHFPVSGETIIGNRFLMNQGGKGANQAVAVVRIGGIVTFVSKVGKDLFGEQTIESLQNEGVDISAVFIDSDHPSGVAMITVNKNAENCIVISPGANMNLSKSDIDKSITRIKEFDILLMQLEIPLSTVLYAAKLGHELGKKVILNPAPAIALPDELYTYLYMITPNETEAEFLTGIQVTNEKTANKAAALLNKKGVEVVIITMGAKGAYLFADGIMELIPSPKVVAIDTVAAGDTFNGALAVALVECRNLCDAVSFANNAASIAVTREGAQSSIPFRNEIDESIISNLKLS